MVLESMVGSTLLHFAYALRTATSLVITCRHVRFDPPGRPLILIVAGVSKTICKVTCRRVMPNPHFVGPVPASTPAESGISRGNVRALPYDLLREAARRLGIMSLLAAALWVLTTVLDHLAIRATSPGDPRWMQPLTSDAIAGASTLVSLALFSYTRKDNRDPRFILDLGLGYMVLTSAAIGLISHMDPVPEGSSVYPMISWLGAVVLMFAAIVPNPPMRTLVAGLIAVSMNPLGMLIAKARGTWDFGAASNVLVMHYPDYMLVGVSVVISHVVTRLGRQITRAREMGSYQLVTMLGKGGMGEVWRASHRMLARDAAIKLIQPDMLIRNFGKNADLMRRRFEQEARTTASLRSPHTVQLYDFGVSEDSAFYYVMELLDGIDLESLIRKFGPQPPARVVFILRQVCRSLAEAHRHGIIHRDIKPSNIFLCRMGNEYDFAKVLDFGLVKVLEDGNETPELALGSPHIDGRTDLYGLGCVAYWLLTGSLVFEETGGTAMMLAHVHQVPVPPSQRGKHAVPASLDRAIMMCLAKKPAERPAAAETLASVLDSCDDVGSWSKEDAERWWQSNMPEDAVRVGGDANPVHTKSSASPTL
ncbi:MAG: serine/threonine protein kinase [Acidobacteria bacterium]|nr:MAG: serine/threonine protein kinase [Acidobacteriota bacterium]